MLIIVSGHDTTNEIKFLTTSKPDINKIQSHYYSYDKCICLQCLLRDVSNNR